MGNVVKLKSSKMDETPFPVVFLDFDGVLNNMGSVTAFGTSQTFDPVSVSLLARLCSEAGAKIVVSSSWRPMGQGQLNRLTRSMWQAGAEELVKFVIGYTDRLISGIRGAEVAKWIRDNRFTGPYVIFDDDSDFYPDQPLIQCSQGRGLGLCEYVRALDLIDPLNPGLTELREFVGMRLGGQRVDWYDTARYPARYAGVQNKRLTWDEQTV